MERTNLLNEFFNSKSDANKHLSASQQESLENDFQQYLTEDKGELHTLDFVNEMCLQSLDPDTFEKWEEVKAQLKANRKLLKKFNYT